MSGPLRRKGNHQRKFVRWNRVSTSILGSEGGRPDLGRHRPGLIKTLTKDQLSRLVVKQQVAILVDKKDRDAQISGELPRQDNLRARVFDVDDPPSAIAALADMAVVANCAGPFATTSALMIDACLNNQLTISISPARSTSFLRRTAAT